MKKAVAAVALLMMCSGLLAWGQEEYPRKEIFAGFSLLSADLGSQEQFRGWQTSVAGNFNEKFGLVADFGGQYKNFGSVTAQDYQFLFGPQLSIRGDKATGFIHGLVGGTHDKFGSAGATGLMIGIGGGVDIRLSNRLALRAFQFDWTPDRFSGHWTSRQARLGVGLVFN